MAEKVRIWGLGEKISRPTLGELKHGGEHRLGSSAICCGHKTTDDLGIIGAAMG